MEERGELPAEERVSLDAAGRAVSVTAVQLAAEAMQWWQRGAAFHDAEAMRLLGMGESRGFTGKRNLGAAVAYWRDAAARGDAIARLELGHLYFYGTGVEADSDKALDLFRQASDQGILRAAMALGTALAAKGIAGDVEAAREAMRALDVVVRKSLNAAERTYAHYVIGLFLSEVGHPTVRDPPRALDHFRFAARGGHGEAFTALARAHETGVGAEPDVVKAFGYLMLLRARDPTAADREFMRLSSRLTPDERERAKSFSLAHDPISPAFLNEYQIRQAPGLLKGVSSSLRSSP
jgi:TPR repeat protein